MTMIYGNNVIKLNNTIVKEHIDLFLAKKARKSDETKIGYERDIKKFFQIVKGKEKLEFLTEEDLVLSYKDFEKFINVLETQRTKDGDLKYSSKTINRNISAVKSLLRELSKFNLIEKSNILFLSDVESLPEDDNEYDAFTEEEIEYLKTFALEERNQKQIKHFLIRLAYETCLRKEALLSLKWSDFKIEEDQVKFKAIDKGNKTHRRTIGIEFFDELKSIRQDNKEEVFNISTKTINIMMKNFVKKLPTETVDRKLVFHSIRKASANFAYSTTKDILYVQELLGHSSLETTQIYVKNLDFGNVGAESLKARVDGQLYRNSSLEELIAAIELLPESQRVLINLKLNQLQKDKKN